MNPLDLYNIPAPYQPLLDVDAETERDPDELAAYLDAMRDETRDQVLWLARAVRSLEADGDKIAEAVRWLAGKRARRERRAKWLRAWMLSRMEGWGIERAKDSLLSVNVQDNTTVSVEVTDPAAVPDAYWWAVLEMPLSDVPEGLRDAAALTLRTKEIRATLKDTGEIVDGVNIVKGRHVVIR